MEDGADELRAAVSPGKDVCGLHQSGVRFLAGELGRGSPALRAPGSLICKLEIVMPISVEMRCLVH